MTQALDVFIEYKIHEKYVKPYEENMKKIKERVQEMGASDFEWYEAADQPNLYVEMFKVNDYAAYEKIKSLRQDESESLTKDFSAYVAGGSSKVHCWAFKRKMI
ncbi:MFS transporter [Alkalihalophilus pseudofirmus]|uniref:MFS transporter n=1 Tax=Alkalihalophilus pseudofirmus TaxID=79885 RepID=UPI00259BD9A7|nr:MFS transporter [Alkalihalophilus pseudofirmus]WEG17510.1 MFS transporter [Alkalihalophilus pseudofirmus]